VTGRRILVLHGWPNRRPTGHWQWQTVEELRRAGEQVLYPQLPDPDRPSRATWSEVVRAELLQLGDGERVVVAHSLSSLLWLHLAPRLTVQERVSRVLLVAPPDPSLVGELEVAEFADLDAAEGAAAVKASGDLSVVASDDDPYSAGSGIGVVLDRLGLPTVTLHLLSGQGHLDPDAGYGTWPSMVAWCRDPSTPLRAR